MKGEKNDIILTCCLDSFKQAFFLISGISLRTPNSIVSIYLH